MAYSYTAFTGNGSTTQYAVSFPYIRREHVAVTVAGIPSTFTWVNNSLIQMDAAPANGAAVRVYRTTPIDAPLVDFADGSTLVAADLDTNSRQSIYIQQELNDAQTDNLPNVIPNGNKGDITTSVGGTVWAINSGAVLEAKIGTGAVTEAKLGAGSVTSAKILDGTIVNADVNASAGITAGKLSFTQAGTGAVARTVDSKLKDVVSVKDFGAVGDGVTNDTTAIQNAVAYIASVSGGTLFFPGGTYVLDTTVNVKNTASGGIFPAESTIRFEGAGATKSTIYWLGGGAGLTGTAFDWGSGVYGGFSDLRFTTAAIEGHTTQVLDGFTTSTSVFAGCSATSSTAIKHAYNGSFSIDRCDFYKFHRAAWMDLGYNRSVRDCSMMFCNVGIGTYGAATINHYLNNKIERCAIGMSFVQTSTISCESNVTQANYAGCDVYIGTATHSLHFLRQYFEASPKAVFIQGGGTGNPTVTPSGHVFDECNSINITSQGRLNEIYLIRGLCTSVPIEHAGADAATYYAIDCYQHSGGARIPAVGYNMGVAVLFESGFAKSAVPGSFGVGTNSPAGNYFARYATIESATYPGFGLRSTGAGGRMYSMGQDIVSSNGILYWRDETANATRLLLDHTGRFAPGADNTQTLGSAGNRWSTVFAGTGTINTSDGRDKQDVSSLDDAEQQVALTLKGLIKKFRFKDAVQAKGHQARIHIGVVVQDVIAAFEVEGLDPMRYGIVCHDQWKAEFDEDGKEIRPAGDRYGIRYEELLAFIISAL